MFTFLTEHVKGKIMARKFKHIQFLLKNFLEPAVLLKKAGAGHFTECAPGFLSRFHQRFLAQNLIFYVHQKKTFKEVLLDTR